MSEQQPAPAQEARYSIPCREMRLCADDPSRGLDNLCEKCSEPAPSREWLLKRCAWYAEQLEAMQRRAEAAEADMRAAEARPTRDRIEDLESSEPGEFGDGYRCALASVLALYAPAQPAPVATPPVPTDVAHEVAAEMRACLATTNVSIIGQTMAAALQGWASRLAAVSPQPAADLRALLAKWRAIAKASPDDSQWGDAHDQCAEELEAALASAPQPAEGRTQEKER